MKRMRRMRRGLAVPAFVLAAVLVAAGCTGGGGGGETSKPLVIGASLPGTGDFAQPGEASKRGYTIWQDMVNSGGGLLGRQVQLKIVDDASSQDTVVSDYNRLISQDKVDLLLGTFSSLLNIPASAVAEKAGMTYICPSCGSPNMFNRKFKHIFFAQPATAAHQPICSPSTWPGYPRTGGPRPRPTRPRTTRSLRRSSTASGSSSRPSASRPSTTSSTLPTPATSTASPATSRPPIPT